MRRAQFSEKYEEQLLVINISEIEFQSLLEKCSRNNFHAIALKFDALIP